MLVVVKITKEQINNRLLKEKNNNKKKENNINNKRNSRSQLEITIKKGFS